jgi:hypothetical protein
VYIFGQLGNQNGNYIVLAFLRPAYYGLLHGPIKSASTQGVRFELFCQALSATVGESEAGCGLYITAYSGWRGRSHGSDFEDEWDIGGND